MKVMSNDPDMLEEYDFSKGRLSFSITWGYYKNPPLPPP
jgi:hypothetical protein